MSKQLKDLRLKIENVEPKQYAMAFLLIVLLLVRFVFLPWYQDLEQQQQELNQLYSVVKNPAAMTEQLEQLKKELSVYEENMSYWQDKFFKGTESQVKIEFANKITSLIREQGLTQLRSKWGRVSKRQQEQFELLKVQKYDVTIRSDYKRLLNFIKTIQKHAPLIRITNLSVSKRAATGIATMTVSLSVLYQEQQ